MSPELHPCTASSTLGSVTATPSYTGLTVLYQRARAESRAKAWTAAGSSFSGFSEFLSLLMVKFGWEKNTSTHRGPYKGFSCLSLQTWLRWVFSQAAVLPLRCPAWMTVFCSSSLPPRCHLHKTLLATWKTSSWKQLPFFHRLAHLQHLTAARNKHPVLLQKTTSSFQSWVTDPKC